MKAPPTEYKAYSTSFQYRRGLDLWHQLYCKALK